jgi:O-acetyl-ADP-ribose deacetylase (regulator of RNase III)
MNMRFVIGDLLDHFEAGDVDAIVHVCNCQGVMGSGLALQVKSRFPDAYDAYIRSMSSTEIDNRLGTISFSKHEDKRFIFNLHAQFYYGSGKHRYLNYEALYKCLCSVASHMKMYNVNSLGIPYLLGCNRAGGDWKIVHAMIEAVFEKIDIKVTIYHLK